MTWAPRIPWPTYFSALERFKSSEACFPDR